uniref:Uncharacterized protein n=1 Tax=Arion vulgaris TaxID=1028688 RepID=A0A0B7AZQ0_9EUPU
MIETSDKCDCGTDKMASEHTLQKTMSLWEQFKLIWPLTDKFFEDIDNLRLATVYFENIHVTI